MSQETIETPPETIEVSIDNRTSLSVKASPTLATLDLRLDQVKHLLSDKPLRRPHRQRPLGK